MRWGFEFKWGFPVLKAVAVGLSLQSFLQHRKKHRDKKRICVQSLTRNTNNQYQVSVVPIFYFRKMEKQKVICDTNIWYELNSGDIDSQKIKAVNLIGTILSVRELASIYNMIKDISRVK